MRQPELRLVAGGVETIEILKSREKYLPSARGRFLAWLNKKRQRLRANFYCSTQRKIDSMNGCGDLKGRVQKVIKTVVVALNFFSGLNEKVQKARVKERARVRGKYQGRRNDEDEAV